MKQDEKKKYITAVVLSKGLGGQTNIVLRTGITFADSVDEAVGSAIHDARDKNPEHSILLWDCIDAAKDPRKDSENANG